LEAEAPLLHIGRAQVAVNGAELERLGDVAANGLPRQRVNRVRRAVGPGGDARLSCGVGNVC
jgi:hypothetical protein